MKTFVSLFGSKAFKFGLLACLFVTSALIAIAMILGKEAGYFSIRVQNGDAIKTITLSLDPNDEMAYTTGLDADAIDDFDQTSPDYILSDNMRGVKGVHQSERGAFRLQKAYGYSFYVINTTSNGQPVTVEMTLNITKKDGLERAIRVLTFYQSNGQDVFNVYQMEDDIEKDYSKVPGYDFIYNQANKTVLKWKKDEEQVFKCQRMVIPGSDNEETSILGTSARFQLMASVVE